MIRVRLLIVGLATASCATTAVQQPVASPISPPEGPCAQYHLARRGERYWLAKQPVTKRELDQALWAQPSVQPAMRRSRAFRAVSTTLFTAGIVLGVGVPLVYGAANGWRGNSLVPIGLGLGFATLAVAAVPLSLGIEQNWLRAVQDYNTDATTTALCPLPGAAAKR